MNYFFNFLETEQLLFLSVIKMSMSIFQWSRSLFVVESSKPWKI